MRKQELEAWVLEVCDATIAGRPVEDDRVELKAVWPEPDRKVARQIAGHANVAAGSTLLWVIGADERGRVLRSPEGDEPADWWARTVRHFAGIGPDLLHTLVVPAHGERVIGLFIQTDRAPYLVTTDGHGGVEREVPWRAANGTRSAHREELLRTVVEQARVPHAEALDASLTLRERQPAERRTGPPSDHPFTLALQMRLFISATAPCHLPEHRQALTVHGTRSRTLTMSSLSLRGPRGAPIKVSTSGIPFGEPLTSLVVAGNSGLQVNTSDQLTLFATAHPGAATADALRHDEALDLTLHMGVDRADRSMTVRATLDRTDDSELPQGEQYEDEAAVALFQWTPPVP